jgi:hypothetical protein
LLISKVLNAAIVTLVIVSISASVSLLIVISGFMRLGSFVSIANAQDQRRAEALGDYDACFAPGR